MWSGEQGRAGARVHPRLLHPEKGLPRHSQVLAGHPASGGASLLRSDIF
jgi:hypothetical protein